MPQSCKKVNNFCKKLSNREAEVHWEFQSSRLHLPNDVHGQVTEVPMEFLPCISHTLSLDNHLSVITRGSVGVEFEFHSVLSK